MAGVDVGESGKRSVNREVNMIPFIDLLMVTIAFLLITAVWVSHSQIKANAQVPGPGIGDAVTPSKDLHVFATPNEFVLAWKQGSTIISEARVPRRRMSAGPPYPDLADKIAAEWKANGLHRDVSDRDVDRAVFHSENNEPFSEVVAVMDAIYAAKREMVRDGQRRNVSAFNMAFASN